MLMLGLWGCDGGNCPDWDEIEVTDPEGVATEADFTAVDETLAAFSSWVGGVSVCVGEVRLVTEAEAEVRDHEVGGYYSRLQDRIVVTVEDGWVHRMTTHELCHALDQVEGYSETWSDLLPDYEPEDELYPIEESKLGENFARSCEGGPGPRALSEAFEAACGPGDPWLAVLRDEVFAGYTEEVSIGVGEWLTVTSVDVPPLPDGAYVTQAVAGDGGIAALYQVAEGYRVVLLDLTTLTWGTPVAIPVTVNFGFAQTLPDAAPLISLTDETGEVTLRELRDGALVDPGLDWLVELLEEEDYAWSFTLGANDVVWQRWNDGEPLQERSRHTDDTRDLPGDVDLALHPTPIALPEGQLVWNFRSLAPCSQAYNLDDDGVSPFDAPVGVDPIGSSLVGQVVATGTGYVADYDYTRPWILRDPDGAWLLDPSTCDEAYDGHWATAGDRTYRFSWADSNLVLEEATVEGD